MSDAQPRNHTGTVALMFSGQSDSVVMVPSEDHPPIITDELTIRYMIHILLLCSVSFLSYHESSVIHLLLALCYNTITCSLWLMMAEGASGGVLVAKITTNGLTTFYGLEVMANGDSFLIRFSYLPASRTVYTRVE